MNGNPAVVDDAFVGAGPQVARGIVVGPVLPIGVGTTCPETTGEGPEKID